MLKLLFTSILITAGSMLTAQEKSFRDTLVSDFKTFVHYLETTHPDPYTGLGGKVFFHKKAAEFERQLRERDYTTKEFIELTGAFIAPLEDGHTWIKQREKDNVILPDKAILIGIKVIPDNLIINGIPDSLKQFIGSRIKTVNHIPVEELLKLVSQKIACENLYGQYMNLANQIPQYTLLKQFIPNLADKVTLGVLLPDGTQGEFSLPYLDMTTWKKEAPKASGCPSWEKVKGMNNISYRFLDDENKTMYFCLNSVMAREAFLFMYNNKWNGYEKQIESYYKNKLKKQMPANIDSAIAGIPTMAEQFGNMLDQMKKHTSKNLIIDLRNNGGGFTPITLPTLYQLYGDRYLQTNMGDNYYKLISPLYIQKIKTSLEEYNKMNNTSYQFGDYVFDNEKTNNQLIEQLRKNFIEQSLGNAAQYISGLNGTPLFTPDKVFVVTNAQTFSAAFHYAFYLWKMGAVVVGVPSSQAPNTFMEQTPFTLPLTKIGGSISNSAQYFLPLSDKRAKTFYPQFIPTYNDYKKYNFDTQTELLYLLDNCIQ